MSKRIYNSGYVKDFNPKTGVGAISMDSQSRVMVSPATTVAFNTKDSVCKLATKIFKGMKVNVETDEKGTVFGILPTRD